MLYIYLIYRFFLYNVCLGVKKTVLTVLTFACHLAHCKQFQHMAGLNYCSVAGFSLECSDGVTAGDIGWEAETDVTSTWSVKVDMLHGKCIKSFKKIQKRVQTSLL